jgi:hypothetical protein
VQNANHRAKLKRCAHREHKERGERINLAGDFGLFINPASKARFPTEAELGLPIALTLGLARYLASAGG